MKVYNLKRQQFLPIGLEEAWDFFSSPSNLSRITPEKLGFKIVHNLPSKMYQGMIIQYFIKPMFNIPVRWVTEITHVDEPYFFVDEQRIGPYRLWHHEHKFREVDGGVIMEDEVHYALPFGIMGRWFHALKIRSDIQKIFNYRTEILKSLFPNTLKFSEDAA